MHYFQLWTVYFEYGCWNMQSVWIWLLLKVGWIGVYPDCKHSVSWSVCVVVWRSSNDCRWNYSYVVSYCYFWWKFKRAILFPSISAQHTFRFKSRYASPQRRSNRQCLPRKRQPLLIQLCWWIQLWCHRAYRSHRFLHRNSNTLKCLLAHRRL